MYNLNSIEGKKARIEELTKLIVKVAEVPGDHLSYLEGRQIMNYLIDVKRDLESQLKSNVYQAPKKKYKYFFVNENLTINADNGDEAMVLYHQRFTEEPSGRINITNMITGETNTMYPIKFN